jgi:hypothetical protein
VRARCLSFSRTFATAFLLTGLSGSGACESNGKSSPLVRLSNPREDVDALVWLLYNLLVVSLATGGGAGANACQKALRSIDAIVNAGGRGGRRVQVQRVIGKAKRGKCWTSKNMTLFGALGVG